MAITKLQVTKPAASIYSSGSIVESSAGVFGDQLVSEINPRFYNLVEAGLVYGVQYASGATAAASATAVGAFSLFNPPSSGKALVLIDIAIVLASFSAGTSTFIAGLVAVPNQTPTTVTAGNTPVNLLIGSSNGSVAKPYTAGTIVGAPTTACRILGGYYCDLAAGDVLGYIKDQIDGGIVVNPGSMVNIVSLAATPTILAHITWAEVPA